MEEAIEEMFYRQTSGRDNNDIGRYPEGKEETQAMKQRTSKEGQGNGMRCRRLAKSSSPNFPICFISLSVTSVIHHPTGCMHK